MSDEYTPTTERVRDLFTWAYAWRTEDSTDGDEPETDLSGLRASNRAEFDRWLAEHDREVAERTIAEHAQTIAEAHREETVEALVQAYAKALDDLWTALAASNTIHTLDVAMRYIKARAAAIREGRS